MKSELEKIDRGKSEVGILKTVASLSESGSEVTSSLSDTASPETATDG